MVMPILLFLLKHWQLVAIGLMAAVIFGGTQYVHLLRGENKVIADKLEIAKESIKSLQQAINDQNAAIDKMKADSDAREARGQAEIAQAKIKSDSLKKQAEDLMKKQTPQGVSKCDAANQWINEEIKNAKK
jgi:uncharacterized protein YlxW (UPF0749 family)